MARVGAKCGSVATYGRGDVDASDGSIRIMPSFEDDLQRQDKVGIITLICMDDGDNPPEIDSSGAMVWQIRADANLCSTNAVG